MLADCATNAAPYEQRDFARRLVQLTADHPPLAPYLPELQKQLITREMPAPDPSQLRCRSSTSGLARPARGAAVSMRWRSGSVGLGVPRSRSMWAALARLSRWPGPHTSGRRDICRSAHKYTWHVPPADPGWAWRVPSRILVNAAVPRLDLPHARRQRGPRECRHGADANRQLAGIQDRMPVIIERDDWPLWLGETAGDLGSLLRPAPEDVLRVWPVGKAVGNFRNDGPQLLEPIAVTEPTLL